MIGFKPPHGRNPQEPPFNHDQYCVVGPMARTVQDCILMQNVMSGPHSKDITSLKPKLTIPNTFKNINFEFETALKEKKYYLNNSNFI